MMGPTVRSARRDVCTGFDQISTAGCLRLGLLRALPGTKKGEHSETCAPLRTPSDVSANTDAVDIFAGRDTER